MILQAWTRVVGAELFGVLEHPVVVVGRAVREHRCVSDASAGAPLVAPPTVGYPLNMLGRAERNRIIDDGTESLTSGAPPT